MGSGIMEWERGEFLRAYVWWMNEPVISSSYAAAGGALPKDVNDSWWTNDVTCAVVKTDMSFSPP